MVHFLRSRGKRTWSGARNLFYDYFVTPRVAFLPRHTIEEWAEKQQAHIVRYEENRGQNVHSFLVEKKEPNNRYDLIKAGTLKELIEEKQETP